MAGNDSTLTMEKIEEAKALLKALAPREAPEDMLMLKMLSGLRIMKNGMLPNDVVIVSKNLFDAIFDCGVKDGS